MQIVSSVHERSVRGALPETVDSATKGLAARPAFFILSRAKVANKGCENTVKDCIRRFFLEDVFGEDAHLLCNGLWSLHNNAGPSSFKERRTLL